MLWKDQCFDDECPETLYEVHGHQDGELEFSRGVVVQMLAVHYKERMSWGIGPLAGIQPSSDRCSSPCWEIPPEELYVPSHQEELQVHQVLLHAEHLCTYLAASPFIDNVTLWIEEPSLWTQPPPPHQELFFASETLSDILVYFYTPTAKISM